MREIIRDKVYTQNLLSRQLMFALGVMIYEQLIGSTPFSPPTSSDIAQLFTNIALVQKRGLNLSSRIDTIEGMSFVLNAQYSRLTVVSLIPHHPSVGGAVSKSLVSSLLRAAPNERLGYQQG